MKKLGVITSLNENKNSKFYPAKYQVGQMLLNNRNYSFSLFHWENVEDDGTILGVYTKLNGDIKKVESNLSEFDLVYMYSLGAIYDKTKKFTDFLHILKNKTKRCINDPSTMIENLDKGYLIYLQKKSISVVPTKKIGNKTKLEELLEIEFEGFGNEKVIKPKVGGERGFGVKKLSEFQNETEFFKYCSLYNEGFILQPYLEGIKNGEYSLIFLGEELMWGVNRARDCKHDFRSNYQENLQFNKYTPSKKEIDIAKQIFSAWETPFHITRLDMIKNNGKSFVNEVEMINPNLFIETLRTENTFIEKIIEYFDKILDGKNHST